MVPIFDKLCEDPFHHPELDIKKLVNMECDYRLRVGQFRFFYTVFETKIVLYVYRADSRGGIYIDSVLLFSNRRVFHRLS
jgi:mRNA-degrading endonuclease RelE of RelBE toxin-antitoxin system